MPWAAKHRSNHEVIQSFHMRSKTFEEDLAFYGMEISDNNTGNGNECLTLDTPQSPRLYRKFCRLGIDPSRWLPSKQVGCRLGVISDSEEGWSEIEAKSPMSPTDKVTEFLLHSQTMLQSFSQAHRIPLPNVRLEINREISSDPKLLGSHKRDIGIKSMTLHATVYRNATGDGATSSRISASRTRNGSTSGKSGNYDIWKSPEDPDESGDSKREENNYSILPLPPPEVPPRESSSGTDRTGSSRQMTGNAEVNTLVTCEKTTTV